MTSRWKQLQSLDDLSANLLVSLAAATETVILWVGAARNPEMDKLS